MQIGFAKSWIVGLVLVFSSGLASAEVTTDAAELLPGLQLFEEGAFEEAARSWGELSDRLNDPFGDDETLQRAGVAAVLSSLAWERAGDSRAYSWWARSIEVLLKARSSWNLTRDDVVAEAEQAQRNITRADPEDGAINASADLNAVIALVQQLDLKDYNGPRPGLTESPLKLDEKSVSKGYFARPLALVEQDDAPDEEVPGLRQSAVDEEDQIDSGPLIGRGMDDEQIDEVVEADDSAPLETETGTLGELRNTGVDTSDTARGVAPAAEPETPVDERLPEPDRTEADDDAAIPELQNAAVEKTRTVMGVEIVDAPTELFAPPVRQDDSATDEVVDTSTPESADPGVAQDTPETASTQSKLPQADDLESVDPESVEAIETVEVVVAEPEVSDDSASDALVYGETHEALAAAAWRYFVRNRHERTGMINAVQAYPRSTMWDVGSGLAAIVSAEKLGLISRTEFREWLDLYLRTMQDLPLYNNELPNREYSIDTGRMIGRGNRRDDIGTGWSALDIGRTMIWLRIVWNWYPEMRGRIESLNERWDFSRLVTDKRMNGTFVARRGEKYYREGRLGYEQYSASGFTLWGFDLADSLDYDFTETVKIEDETLIYDTRPRPFYTSDPFVLARIELGGIDGSFSTLTDLFYGIQKAYWERTGELRMSFEDSLDKKPWFAYQNLSWFDEPWGCVAFSGKNISECPTFSTKNAVGWSVIYNDGFSQFLASSLNGIESRDRGLYAGRYGDGKVNKSLNINTNAIVLEALLYLKRGGKPFIDMRRKERVTARSLSVSDETSE